MALAGLRQGLECALLGIKDSIIGVWPVFRLIKQNEKIAKQLLQCFLLNGVILSFSVIMFDYVVLPAIQYVAGFIYGIISDPSQSGILQWLSTILWYLFTGFWVLPVFWISKPINSIWFQDIASTVFQETEKQKQSKKKRTKTQQASQSLSQSISRFIADLLFSVFMELLFLVQAMLVGLVPGVGGALSVFHMAMLYALYSFEYKWMYQGWIVHQRVAFIERRWPYFLGFGLPLAILTTLPSSSVISACIFAVAFPLFIISANSAQPPQSMLPQIPVFKVVTILSNKLFNRSDPTPYISAPSASLK